MSEITLTKLKEIHKDIKYLIGYRICDSFASAVKCAEKQNLPKEDIQKVSGWYGEFNDLTVRPEPYIEAAMKNIQYLEAQIELADALVLELLESLAEAEERS